MPACFVITGQLKYGPAAGQNLAGFTGDSIRRDWRFPNERRRVGDAGPIADSSFDYGIAAD